MLEHMFVNTESAPNSAVADPVGDEPRWLVGLNPEQREAVYHDGSALLIVAGAGTGKTKTLAARVARLLDDGVDPDRVLLLTFTRRAAQEMLNRVAAMTDRRAAARVWGGTFHSVANRLLRAHGESVGLSPSFTVLDPGDSADLFGLVRNELGYAKGARRFPRAETLSAIYSRVVNSQNKLSDVVTEHFPWCVDHVEAVGEIVRGYTARKRRQHVLDYDDLLLHWRGLAASPLGGEAMRSRFDHVLVDEYQDTNTIQADVVASLCSGPAAATVVGDDAQAIYGFRAASVENMWQFATRFPGARTVTLARNYRSTMPILAIANGVISQSSFLIPKELSAERDGGSMPRLVTCGDEAFQSTWICDEVMRLREQGTDLRDQAVLFRTGHHSAHLELELGRRDVPFVKFGGLKFLEAGHIKDMLCLLRVLDNPSDELAWSRVLGSLDGVGPASTRRLFEQLGIGSDESENSLSRFLSDDLGVSPRSRDDIEALRDAWIDCLGTQGSSEHVLPPAGQVDRLRAICERTFPRRYENAEARLSDLDQLAVLASPYQSRSRFLTEVVLDPPERTGDLAGPPHLDDEYLTLSTIHSAKGCEWAAVHLLHAADGNLPSDMAINDAEGLDEELRLAYVAVTRAKSQLNVTFPMRYHVHRHGRDDRHHYAQLSRFFEPLRNDFELVACGSPDHVDAIDSSDRVDLTVEVDAMLEGLWE